MNEFDMMPRAIVADPAEDTPKLAFIDYLTECRQSELAEIVGLKMRLMTYEPIHVMLWIPNPCQAAQDIRDQIKNLETEIMEDGVDDEQVAIDHAMFLVVRNNYVEKHPGREFRGNTKLRIMLNEMLGTIARERMPKQKTGYDSIAELVNDTLREFSRMQFQELASESERHIVMSGTMVDPKFNLVVQDRRRHFVIKTSGD